MGPLAVITVPCVCRLQKNISLVVDDPHAAYPDINSVWAKFMAYFGKVTGLKLYAPVFEDYLWEGLKQFREDNVQYLEIRGTLPKVSPERERERERE